MTTLHRVFALSTLVLFSLFSSIQSETNLSVKQYNAVGDGVTYDTAAIQASIDFCAKSGGGHVVLPPGTYLSGTINLKSGVFLVIQAGAKLVAGNRIGDYPADPAKQYLILAENAHDVSVGGEGEIDGQGLTYVQHLNPVKNVMKAWRPKLVGFLNCQNALFSKVKLTNPAHWSLHIARTTKATIADISITGDFNTPDTNGIVIEDSRELIITRCHIEVAGDGIVLMTNKGPTYNVIGTQTYIRSKSVAIRLGDVSFFDIKDILFVDMTIVDSHSGIALQMRDGGNINNATFTNMDITTQYYDRAWVGNSEPISITTCKRNRGSKPAGHISTLMFYNVTTKSENGILVSGSNAGGILHNVKFVRHNMVYSRKTKFPAGGLEYGPGCAGLVNANNAAITMERVEGVMELEDIDIKYDKNAFPAWKNPLSYNPADVANLLLIRFHSTPAQPAPVKH